MISVEITGWIVESNIQSFCTIVKPPECWVEFIRYMYKISSRVVTKLTIMAAPDGTSWTRDNAPTRSFISRRIFLLMEVHAGRHRHRVNL